MVRVHWVWIVLVSAGCASAPQEPLPASPPLPTPEPRAEKTASAEPVAEPEDGLTLPKALALALTRSPELEAYSWEVRASEARQVQAGLVPNPVLGLSVENVLGTGDFSGGKEAQTTLQLSQAVELGGKRSARKEVAAVGRELAGVGYEVKRVEVLSRATEHFIHLVADQHRQALAEEGVKLAESFLEAAKHRVESGKASEIEEKRAQILLGRARISLEHAEHELLSTRRQLAATWGNSEPRFRKVEGDLFTPKSLPALEKLAGRISRSPEIARWITEARLREAEVKLAETKRISNLSLGAGVRRLEGSDDAAFIFELSMPLPLFDRNQGGVAEARSLFEKAGAERRAAEVRLGAVLYGLYQELKHSVTQMESLKKEVIPNAEASLGLALGLFEQGRFSSLEFLDAQKTLLEVKQELIEAAAIHHQYVVEIEKLIGSPLEGEAP